MRGGANYFSTMIPESQPTVHKQIREKLGDAVAATDPDLGDYIFHSGVFPWQEHPFRLISWLDMLKFSAEKVSQAWYAFGILYGIAAARPEGSFITQQIVDSTKATLSPIIVLCDRLELPVSAKAAKRLADVVSIKWKWNRLQSRIEELKDVLTDEMEAHLFLWIPFNKARIYANPLIGLEEVVGKFPSAKDELFESGQCYGLSRFTGSVFHLMRAIGPFLAAISRELGPLKHCPSWDAYIKAFTYAISAKYSGKTAQDKERREFYSGIAAHLSSIKDAWRNPTMHEIAKTYNEQQALDVRHAACAFMRHLATKLKE